MTQATGHIFGPASIMPRYDPETVTWHVDAKFQKRGDTDSAPQYIATPA